MASSLRRALARLRVSIMPTSDQIKPKMMDLSTSSEVPPPDFHLPNKVFVSRTERGIFSKERVAKLYASRITSIRQAKKSVSSLFPDKPQRPASSWVEFYKEKSKELIEKEGRGLTVLQMNDTIKQLWKEADRAKYEESYRRRREQYEKDYEEWFKSLNEEQLNHLSSVKDHLREFKIYNDLLKTHPPVNPRWPIHFYFHERYKSPEVTQVLREVGKKIVGQRLTEDFSKLSPIEKKKYDDLAREDRKRFRREFNEWYHAVLNDKKLSPATRDLACLIKERRKSILESDD